MDYDHYRVKPDQEVFLSDFATRVDRGIDKETGKKQFNLTPNP